MPFLGTTGGGSVKQYGGQANLGYFIKNSLRFRSSASAYLNRTSGTPTSQNIYTISFWVKRGKLGASQEILGAGTVATDAGRMDFLFNSDDTITIAGGLTVFRKTNAVFRDPSAWYHIVLSVSLSGTVNLYVNNVAQTFATSNTWTTSAWNAASTVHRFGYDGSGSFFDGYLTEINFIDGQALTPSSFGKTDAVTGQWIPKKFASTYGTNGFYLKFADASAATAAAIGKDSSPNGNNWTPNNISVTAGLTYDAMIDSPTLSAAASNYATLNPLTRPAGGGGAFTVGQGNLQTAMSYIGPDSTIAMSSGKWYWEVIPTGGTSGYNPRIGIVPSNHGTYTGTSVGDPAGTYGYEASSGQKGSGGTYVSYGSSYTDADVIGVALDMDNGKLWFSKNGVWNASGDPAAGTNAAYTSITGEYFASVGTGGNGGGFTCHFNFGQRPFAYTPPTGFKSLNTFNLP
jgi:hypothetical protein